MLENKLSWIDSTQNPWNIPLLDLRPITQTMIASSKDTVFAENAVSYAAEDGLTFWGIEPENKKRSIVNLRYQIEGRLHAGVLFSPDCMEHKWAVFFDGEKIIVVRSWLREVILIANTRQEDNFLLITEIIGQFSEGESQSFTQSVFNFLMISHCLSEIVPAPIPAALSEDIVQSAYWAFSFYGKMAYVGTFDENLLPNGISPLGSYSLLHIAAAKSDLLAIEKYIDEGYDINGIASDGLSPLHWSSYAEATLSMKKLIERGADINLQSPDGITVLMMSVESNKSGQVLFLLNSGASVNATDNRGFTALHRAAEMGHYEIVKILLDNAADKIIKADSHTALSLALMNKHNTVVDLLKK